MSEIKIEGYLSKIYQFSIYSSLGLLTIGWSLNNVSLKQIGLIILLTTPLLRVLACVIFFYKTKEYYLALSSAFTLILIGLTLIKII